MQQAPSTRDGILSLLRHRAMTVAELGVALRLTRNAVLLPLRDLEHKGFVRTQTALRTGKAGKPARRFEVVPKQIEQATTAYQALAPHLLETLLRQSGADPLHAMQILGAELHRELATANGTSTGIGLDEALRFIQEHGAELEVNDDGTDTIVISHSCPIGRLVRTDQVICRALASFLSCSTGRVANAECIYEDKLTCRFRLRNS